MPFEAPEEKNRWKAYCAASNSVGHYLHSKASSRRKVHCFEPSGDLKQFTSVGGSITLSCLNPGFCVQQAASAKPPFLRSIVGIISAFYADIVGWKDTSSLAEVRHFLRCNLQVIANFLLVQGQDRSILHPLNKT